MDIDRNNYETSFLLYLDRELKPSEMLEVERFLSENADLQKEFELLQHTVFLPDEIVYEHKDLLFHKEEKRRTLPLFWIRIAASVLLVITAGWLVLTKISNDRKRNIAGSIQSKIIIAPVNVSKNTVNPDLNNKNDAVHKGANDIAARKPEIIMGGEKTIAKRSEPSYQSRGEKEKDKNSPWEKTDHDESVVVMQKSNAATGIQPEGIRKDPGQISELKGTQVPAMVLAVNATKNQPVNDKTDLNDQDLQSDNSISVVALNDQNKSITDFFKKITRQTPDNNKTNNARKVNVSVFQLSY